MVYIHVCIVCIVSLETRVSWPIVTVKRRREKMKRDRDPWPRSGATQLAGGTERRMRSDREKDYPFDRETKTHAAATHACTHAYTHAHAYTHV